MGKINYELWYSKEGRKEKEKEFCASVGIHCYVFWTIPSTASSLLLSSQLHASPAQFRAWKSRIFMLLLELMNMEITKQRISSIKIPPLSSTEQEEWTERKRRRRSRENINIFRVHACWNKFRHVGVSFLHEIPFLFEQRNKYRPRHQHINQ